MRLNGCLKTIAVLTGVLMCASSSGWSLDEEYSRGVRMQIQKIESRLMQDIPPKERARLLWDLATQSRLIGDTVRARFALERLRESPAWSTFPARLDALLQAALIEESQSRFGPASKIYARILNEELSRPEQLSLESTYVGYALRWAECLERAGDSGKAAEVYWGLLDDLPENHQVTILFRLMRNYRYGRPSREDMERLAERVSALSTGSLRWQLAQMYEGKGMHQKAADLFEALWVEQPALALPYMEEMLSALSQTGWLDSFLEEAESRVSERSDRTVARFLAAAYQRLGESEKALRVIKNCQASIANQLLAQAASQSATVSVSIPPELHMLTPELVELEYEALRGVGNTTAALKVALDMIKRRPTDIKWYEVVSRRPGVDPLPLWKTYIAAHRNHAAAYQQAAMALQESGYKDDSVAILKEGAEKAPGHSTVLAYADALIASGSVEQAWRQFERARAQNWANDEFLADRVSQFLQQPSIRTAVWSLSQKQFNRPPSGSWEDLILRNLLVEEGEISRLLDWVSTDTTGLAATRLAQWALFEGRTELALKAYDRVPKESMYRDSARIEMARILRDSGADDMRTYQRIGDLLDPVIDRLAFRPDDPAAAVHMKLEIVELWARVSLSAGEGLTVLERLYTFFGRERETILQQYQPADAQRILLLRGLALSQVGSLDDALAELRALSDTDNAEALFHEARILFWQENYEEAQPLFEQVVTDPGAWRFANDSLQYLAFLNRLDFGSLRLLSNAGFLVWQGRAEDAVPVFRDLAVREYGEDVAEWARYMIGKTLWDAGEKERASAEWERLSQEGDYGWLRDRLRWQKVAGRAHSPTEEVERRETLNEIISSATDTLFGDLARLKIKHNALPTRFFPGDV